MVSFSWFCHSVTVWYAQQDEGRRAGKAKTEWFLGISWIVVMSRQLTFSWTVSPFLFLTCIILCGSCHFYRNLSIQSIFLMSQLAICSLQVHKTISNQFLKEMIFHSDWGVLSWGFCRNLNNLLQQYFSDILSWLRVLCSHCQLSPTYWTSILME